MSKRQAAGHHHPDCNADVGHEGLCSHTDKDGLTEVFGVPTEDGQSYVSHGTAETWDGRKESAEYPGYPGQ